MSAVLWKLLVGLGSALGLAVVVEVSSRLARRWRKSRTRERLRKLEGELAVRYRLTEAADQPVLVGKESRVHVSMGECADELRTRRHGDGPPRPPRQRQLWVMARSPVAPADSAGLAARYSAALPNPQVLLGDPALERVARFSGDPALVLAAMNPKRRRHLAGPIADLTAGQPAARRVLLAERTTAGTAIYGEFVTGTPDPTAVERVTHAFRDLVQAMDADPPVSAETLLNIVREDPCPGVRARSLSVLHQQFAGTQCCARAIGAALQDSDLGLRFLAATLAPPENARSVLEVLVSDEDVPAQVRQVLCERLQPSSDGRSMALQTALPLLEWALGVPTLREMAQKHLIRSSSERLLFQLCERSRRYEDAACLGLLRVLKIRLRQVPADAEPHLVAWLDRPTLDLRTATASLLGAIGTTSAIEPLLAHLGEPEYNRVAHLAVSRIRARENSIPAERLAQRRTAAAGRLSIAAPVGPAGALSVATEEGALSKAEDE